MANFALSTIGMNINNNTAEEFSKAIAEEFASTMGVYTPYIVNNAVREVGLTFRISAIEKSEIERLLIAAFNGQKVESEIYYSTGKDSELEVALKKYCIQYVGRYAEYIVHAAASKVGIIFEITQEQIKYIADKMAEEFAAAVA